jgi:hypothetical protein
LEVATLPENALRYAFPTPLGLKVSIFLASLGAHRRLDYSIQEFNLILKKSSAWSKKIHPAFGPRVLASSSFMSPACRKKIRAVPLLVRDPQFASPGVVIVTQPRMLLKERINVVFLKGVECRRMIQMTVLGHE